MWFTGGGFSVCGVCFPGYFGLMWGWYNIGFRGLGVLGLSFWVGWLGGMMDPVGFDGAFLGVRVVRRIVFVCWFGCAGYGFLVDGLWGIWVCLLFWFVAVVDFGIL